MPTVFINFVFEIFWKLFNMLVNRFLNDNWTNWLVFFPFSLLPSKPSIYVHYSTLCHNPPMLLFIFVSVFNFTYFKISIFLLFIGVCVCDAHERRCLQSWNWNYRRWWAPDVASLEKPDELLTTEPSLPLFFPFWNYVSKPSYIFLSPANWLLTLHNVISTAFLGQFISTHLFCFFFSPHTHTLNGSLTYLVKFFS